MTGTEFITFVGSRIEKFCTWLVARRRQKKLKIWSGEWDVHNLSPLVWAALCNELEEVKRLLEDGVNPNQTNNNGSTALITAVTQGHDDVVKKLLDFGANPNLPKLDNKNREKLLSKMFSGTDENTEFPKSNIKHQADSSGFIGQTALMAAASLGRITLVKILLKADADVNQRNANDKGAIHHASGYGEIVTILRKAGAAW